MAKTLTVATKFKAIDNFSSKVNRMSTSVNKFTHKAQVGFAKVKRAEAKVTKGFNKMLGVVGKLGLAFAGLAIAQSILKSQVELESNLAMLSAITGVTGKEFEKFKKQIDKVSKSQKMFGGDTAKAFEIIGSAKPELLASAEGLAAVAEASIILKKATGGELVDMADALTGTMNQFNLTADQSTRVMNALAAGSQAGAANVMQINESMSVFGTVANAVNVSVEESIGLIEVLAEKNLKGAEAGTKLRNVMTTMAAIKALPPKAIKQLEKYGVNMDIVSNTALPLEQRLEELAKVSGDTTAMMQIFGKQNLVAGQIILQNVDKFKSYTNAVTGTNVAVDQANINSNTLKGRWEDMVNSFKNATTTTNTNSKAMTSITKIMKYMADNMDKVIKIILIFVGVLVALKAISIVMTVVNAALALSELAVLWPILAIIAAIVLIVLVIKNWSKITAWFTKIWKDSMAWVTKIWDKVVYAFKNFNFVDFFRNIGYAILQYMLLPITTILRLVSKLPGKLGTLAGTALDKIDDFTLKVKGDNPMFAKDNSSQRLNADATVQKVHTERINTNNNISRLDIFDNTGNARLQGNNANISLTSNLGF